MKLTKFTHSCVLIQHQATSVLFDPGIFSWNSGLVDVEALPQLDFIVVSHKHGDHMAEPFVRALILRFPDVQWIAPSDAHEDLKSWGVTNITNQSTGPIDVMEVDHAPVEPFGVQVKNLVINWKGGVTFPGDSLDIDASQPVLLLPIQAPWGTTVHALKLADQLKPKYVLPVHDWMWNEAWRQDCYNRFDAVLSPTGTTFLRPKDGEVIEITV